MPEYGRQDGRDPRFAGAVPSGQHFKNEEAILAKIREHLREAYCNSAINVMSFRFVFNRGGQLGGRAITQSYLDLEVKYSYVEGQGA